MWRTIRFGSNLSWVCPIMSQWRPLTLTFCFCEVIPAPQSRAVYLDCRQQRCKTSILQCSSGVINSPQFMSPFSRALPLPTNLCRFDRWNLACGDSGLSLQETLPSTVSKSILTDVLCWGTVAVAPIMNTVFCLSISPALDLLASHRQEETLQWNDAKAFWRRRSSPTGSVWSSQEGGNRHWCVRSNGC